jgi:hypothetical protein
MTSAEFFDEENLCKIIDGCLAIRFPDDYSDMPLIFRQTVDLDMFAYIGFHNTRKEDDREARKRKTVGFFLSDKKFDCVIRKPWNYVERLLQYKQTMSPDVSCYTDMSLAEQWYNTFLNRVIGAYWQSCGLTVIPTVAWSDCRSYDFAFSGIEEGCVVAVSTIGTKAHYDLFMNGFVEMCKRINPTAVLCYCTPYPEMHRYAGIIPIEYEGRQPYLEAKYRPNPNQMTIFDYQKTQMEGF